MNKQKCFEENPSSLKCTNLRREQFRTSICDDWIRMSDSDYDEKALHVYGNREDAEKHAKLKREDNGWDRTRSKIAANNADACPAFRSSFSSTRSGFKLVALDKAFNFRISQCSNNERMYMKNVKRSEKIFYVADLGCGAGDWSSYICARRGFYNTKSLGLSQMDLDCFMGIAGAWPFFLDIYFDSKGIDIKDKETRDGFTGFVERGTSSAGVDLVLGDVVGWNPEGVTKESYNTSLLISQILMGLKVLRHGGNAVIVCFNTYTRTSSGIFFLLYNAFEEVAIHKPFSSRPHNSERFLVCFNYNVEIGSQVIGHLEKILLKMENGYHMEECVSRKFMEDDKQFTEYFEKSTQELLLKQIEFSESLAEEKKAKKVEIKELSEYWETSSLFRVPKFFENSNFIELYESKRETSFSRFNRENSSIYRVMGDTRREIMKNEIIISASRESAGFYDLNLKKWHEEPFPGVPPGTILHAVKHDEEGVYTVLSCGLLLYDDVSKLSPPVRKEAFQKFLRAIKPVLGQFLYYDYTKQFLTPVQLKMSISFH